MHLEFHKKYGVFGNTYSQFRDFFKERTGKEFTGLDVIKEIYENKSDGFITDIP